MFTLMILLSCGGADKPAPRPDFDWSGGDFDFSTVAVSDGCLSGAFEALFMPEGPDTAHAFEYPIYLPAYDELPMAYDIDLREPFMGMPVTVDEGDGGLLEVRGSVMDSVALGAAAYGDCVVTMTVDADLQPTDTDTAEGQARIAVSDARGEDERCPVFDADPCEVVLTLRADRP